MKCRSLLFAAALVLGGLALPPSLTAQEAAPPALPPVTCQVNPVHSTVLFRVKNRDSVLVYGRFDQVAGTVHADLANPANMKIDVQVAAASVDSNNGKRDEHLRSGDFLNSAQFPSITFSGAGAKAVGNGRYQMEGNLTMLGVSKPLQIVFEVTGVWQNGGKGVVGGHCTFQVKRSDFGMGMIGKGVADEVTVVVSLEGSFG